MSNGSGAFNGRQDTNNRSARQAYRSAKDQNGVPRSQSSLSHPTRIPDWNNPGKFCVQYEHVNVNGERIQIRRDNPVDYGDGGPTQGPHYNAGLQGEKLKQHHNYQPKK